MNEISFILWLAGMLLLAIDMFVQIPKVHSFVLILWVLPVGAAAGAALNHKLF